MAHDVFISYGREDMPLMQRVEQALREAGFTTWTDRGIAPGSPSWKAEIEKAILDARCIVVLLSPDSAESRWVRAELDYADAQRKPIYPLLVRGDANKAIPFGFTSYQWIDVRDSGQLNAGLERLIAVLKGSEANLTETTAPNLATAPARSRLMLVFAASLILAGLVLGIALLSRIPQTPSGEIPTDSAAVGQAQPTALPTMPPFSVPAGFKKLEGKKTLATVPTNWTTDIDTGLLTDSLVTMANSNKDAVDMVKTMIQNMDAVGADMLRFQGVAITVEDFGVPISYSLLEARQKAMYQQVSVAGTYNSKGLVEMPAGTMLLAESDGEVTSLVSYMLVRGSLVYSISFTFRAIDKEAVAAIAEKVAQSFRVKE